MIQKFRKKPVVIEAMQWTGENLNQLWDWAGVNTVYGPTEANPLRLYVAANDAWLDLEIGEWVIRDARGFYPCKPDIFEATYEPDGTTLTGPWVTVDQPKEDRAMPRRGHLPCR